MKNFLLVLLFLGTFSSYSQNVLYPKGLAEWERGFSLKHRSAPSGITMPPSSQVRSMAEWEEAQALLITWTAYPTVLGNIVRAAQPEGIVVIVCSDSMIVRQSLVAQQVDPDFNIKYLIAPFNSVWVRDYGPNTVYTKDVDSLYLIDWIYNRPRWRDDTVSVSVARFLDVPLYTTDSAPYDLVNTGGNYMSNGAGMGFSSELVIEENGPDNKYGQSNHDESGIDSIMFRFMGIKEYVKMPVLPYDGIHHIDMHMKILNETTIMVGEYPPDQPDYEQIEANIQYVISNFRTVFDTEYDVIRIPMPPYSNGNYPGNGFNRTYTNAVFFNKTVIIPAYEEKYDTTAIRIWQEALPGYTIAPVNCNMPILAGGAVHCITKEIGVSDPIRILHKPMTGKFEYSGSGYPIVAMIRHGSGISSARIYYRISDENDFTAIEMTDAGDDQWEGILPDLQPGTGVDYYIEAETISGRKRNLPLPAPRSFWSFHIEKSLSLEELLTPKPGLLDIYPNPASAITCIPVKNPENKEIHIYLIDGFGRKLKTIYSGRSDRKNHFIDARELRSGVYFVVLSSAYGHEIKKLIVR